MPLRGILMQENFTSGGPNLVGRFSCPVPNKLVPLFRAIANEHHAISYPNIKTLSGIGNRMTDAQILKATASTGVVNLDTLSKQDAEAIAVYVAGL